MITREDAQERVTYFGDAPVVDREGYSVEIGCPDKESSLCLLRVAANANGPGPKLRVDLAAAGVRELLSRLVAWQTDHDTEFMRRHALRLVEWLRVNDIDAFAALAYYMQSCLTEGAAR
ncbi:hypothetical protein ACFXG4_03985 [Nocardia sp. NPDC059246]|uniref:hypothetical protein n=1 Tax=unclassified Nocardia TaxID=2637762 RepID=UPI0036A127B8